MIRLTNNYLFKALLLIFSFVSFDGAGNCAPSNVKEIVFYVAPNGNDRWSGTLSSPKASGTDGPFATLHQARNAIRGLKNNGSRDAFTVLVRGGRYQLKETLVLGPEDSGTESHPLVFRPYKNEKPVLSGTLSVSNFEPYKGKVQKASLKAVPSNIFPLRQLFVDGQRQILARYPDFDPANPVGGGYVYMEKPVKAGSKSEFLYHEGTIPEWADLEDAELVVFPGDNYTNNILTVTSIDRVTRTISLSQNATHEFKPFNRYFFQNIFETLDSPGEWFFDRRNKDIYYWPKNDQSPVTASIPALKSILEVRGSTINSKYYGTPTSIRFEGFTLEGCRDSAIVVNGARKVEVVGNTIHNAGKNGIEVQEGSENVVFGNDIYDVGHTGIIISGGDRNNLVPALNRAENNYIHDTGVIFKGGASGILCKGIGNVIAHNLIHSTPRVGIWLEGNDHVLEYNHIHHVNQETEDSGMIYFGQVDWTKRGNVVRYNYLHDSGGYGRNNTNGAWQTNCHTYGIYMDDWTSGTTVYGNVIANTSSGGIFIHGGRDNIVENNIIFNGGAMGQMVYSAIPLNSAGAQKLLPAMFAKVRGLYLVKYPQLLTIKDLETGSKMSGNSFVRNIVQFDGKKSAVYGIYHDFDFATSTSDYNIIHNGGLPLLVPFTKVSNRQQWADWQRKGLDQHSLIADPMIIDAVHGNFALLSDSPVLKIGFKQIPFEKIGPYNDPLRASWPVVERN